jgi:hypothetical protein
MSAEVKPQEDLNGLKVTSHPDIDDNEEGDDDVAGEAPGTGRSPSKSTRNSSLTHYISAF